MDLYCPTAFRRVQITPKTSTNITRYLHFRGRVRQAFRNAQAMNWIEVTKKKDGGQFKLFF